MFTKQEGREKVSYCIQMHGVKATEIHHTVCL